MEDRFFTAFNSDRQIDKLIEADIEFIRYTYHQTTDLTGLEGGTVSVNYLENSVDLLANTGIEYGQYITEFKTLKHTKKIEVQVGLIFKQTYSWTEIESVESFLNSKDLLLSDVAKDNLKNKDWVLNYYTAEYKIEHDMVMTTPIAKHEYGTRVEDVTILRLKYETDGVVFNLGCVDNKSTGSDIASGTNKTFGMKIEDMIKLILTILLLFLVIVVIGPILPTLISFILWVVKTALKIVVWVISLPFKIFGKRE